MNNYKLPRNIKNKFIIIAIVNDLTTDHQHDTHAAGTYERDAHTTQVKESVAGTVEGGGGNREEEGLGGSMKEGVKGSEVLRKPM